MGDLRVGTQGGRGFGEWMEVGLAEAFLIIRGHPEPLDQLLAKFKRLGQEF